MHCVRQARRKSIYLIVLSMLFLSACVGGTKEEITRYFLIDPAIDVPLSHSLGSNLSIEIRDLQIPQYLQRFQIVTRSAENRLRLSEFNQWGENLRENLLRTLARNLNQALSTDNISTPLNRGNTTPDFRVHMHIEQFEHDIDNKVKIAARWEIMNGSKSSTLDIHTFNSQSQTEMAGDDYDAIVSSMQTLFADLSQSVAESLIQQQSP